MRRGTNRECDVPDRKNYREKLGKRTKLFLLRICAYVGEYGKSCYFLKIWLLIRIRSDPRLFMAKEYIVRKEFDFQVQKGQDPEEV